MLFHLILNVLYSISVKVKSILEFVFLTRKNRPIGFKYKLKKINLKNMYNRDKSNFTGYSRNLNYVPANIVSYVNPNDTFYYGADASKNESEDISKKVSPLTIIVVASFIIGGLYLYKKIQNK